MTCTDNGSRGDPTFDTGQAIAVLLEKHGVACDQVRGLGTRAGTLFRVSEVCWSLATLVHLLARPPVKLL